MLIISDVSITHSVVLVLFIYGLKYCVKVSYSCMPIIFCHLADICSSPFCFIGSVIKKSLNQSVNVVIISDNGAGSDIHTHTKYNWHFRDCLGLKNSVLWVMIL